MKAYLHHLKVTTSLDIMTTSRVPSYSEVQDLAKETIEIGKAQDLECEFEGVAEPVETEDYEQ